MAKKKVSPKRKKHLKTLPLVKPDYKRLRDGFTVAVSPRRVGNR